MQRDDGWREAFVDIDGEARLVERLSERFEPVPSVLPERAAIGSRAPLIDRAAVLLDSAIRVVSAGSVVMIRNQWKRSEIWANRSLPFLLKCKTMIGV